MQQMLSVVVGLIVTAWLAPGVAGAGMRFSGQAAYAPCPSWPPAVCAPPVYYPYPPAYYPPPPFYFGSGYDQDYRDIRYNRYFQRDRWPPQIRGYTFPR